MFMKNSFRGHIAGARGLRTLGSPVTQLMISCKAAAAQRKSTAPPNRSVEFSRHKLGGVLTSLALTGATTGTLLDGIHTRVQLLTYDSMPIVVGGLHTSVWIPPLLATFYVALGGLVLFLDYRMAAMGDRTTHHAMRHAKLSRMALSVGALAAMLELSSVLYDNGYASSTICVALAICSFANYLIFDGSKQGLGLALLCAIAAPVSELVLMQTLHLWHYPDGNLYSSIAGGIPSWVPFCYFFYVPFVANLSRYLWRIL